MNNNCIYTEDCVDTMARMPDNFLDLTVTSPPYDSMREYGGNAEFDFPAVAAELFRVTKTGGVVVWVVADQTINGSETGTSFRQALGFMDAGFLLHDTMYYMKDGMPGNINKRYLGVIEYMFVFSKKTAPKTANLLKDVPALDFRIKGKLCRYRNKDGSQVRRRISLNAVTVRKNLWYYPVGMGGTTSDLLAFEHPAIFPENLAADHIRTWSNAGELVYDPFGGSGTTAKMAHLLGRQWIMSERNPTYADIARRRLAHIFSNQQLFEAI